MTDDEVDTAIDVLVEKEQQATDVFEVTLSIHGICLM